MQTASSGGLTTASNFTMLALVCIDALGVLVLFNLNHWLITGELAANLLLTWKLMLILGYTFLYYYLLDLFTFDSTLSQLGILERSFIATLLVGITVALTVYLIGPNFIGGFVGRGVLVSSLLMLWLWSLGSRYVLRAWFVTKRSQVHWLLLVDNVVDDDMDQFLADFRSYYIHEQLLLLTETGSEEADYFAPGKDETLIVGAWQDLQQTVAKYPIAGIIITSAEHIPEYIVNDLMMIRINGTRIYRLSDFYEKFLARLPVFHLNQQWLATAHGFELMHSPIGLRFKRYIDVLIGLVGGIIVLPVMMLTALLVLLTSGTPIFYRQTRAGENTTNFTVYKFRTMKTDAEADGAQFAERDDPRLIPVGKILRKFRLDELPQLWNVLKGDMSFIGPRPERPEFIFELQQKIPYYNLRLLVKPGITGWAQVMCGYGDSTEDAVEKLQYDLFYIKNYSLFLDISILIKSVKVILFGTGR